MIDDDELINIFIEETQDLLSSLRLQLNEWKADPEKVSIIEPVLRELHTLKGNARMIGLKEFSDYIHGLEQLWQCIQKKQATLDDAFVRQVVIFMQGIESYLQDFFKTKKVPKKAIPIQAVKDLNAVLSDPLSHPPQSKAPLINEDEKKKVNADVTPLLTDTIRVKIDDLDKLTQKIAEINIDRGHCEQENRNLMSLLVECRKELKIAQSYVKQLQMKADVTIKSQMVGSEHEGHEGFDILEMDYYSGAQQLTRTIVDKMTQIQNLTQSGLESVKRNEKIIRHQGYASRSLEEGVRHVRLVSLDYFIPRLEHMVDTLAKELGKSVSLKCTHFEGEIDRKIMDRLIAPLEHLIRNAIDHGIELPATREKMGKPKQGVLTLTMVQKGNDIYIKIFDDGHGIDIEAIKARAQKLNLWNGEINLSDQEWYQLIFMSGFSTKKEVTAISGHGVGLDVVNSEIRKLSGTIVVESQLNQGAQFTLRIPVSLSFSQALVFSLGDQLYAILLSQLEGISRLPFQTIQNKILQDNPNITIRHAEYVLFYLATLLDNTRKLPRQAKHKMMPILLIRSASRALGLVVDKLVGSSEIIVKPMSSHIQTFHEINGVSMTSSGEIILVLDPAQIMQRGLNLKIDVDLLSSAWSKPDSHQAEIKNKILVVDDSNTVRTIMSRFLQRHNYQCTSAKDGLEALSLIKESPPDLLLLDLEMPRVNGFEVLEALQKDPQLDKIPVIVITSRGTKKHKEKATALGANAFLTKPYREPELLALIQKWIAP